MKKGRRINNIPKQQVRAEKLYLEGLRKTWIAEDIGASLMTVYRWAKKHNWEEKYKQKYEEELSKITDPHKILLFLGLHRAPKVPKHVKNEQFKTINC